MQRLFVLCLSLGLARPCVADPTQDSFASLLSQHLPSDIDQLQGIVDATENCTDEAATASYNGSQNWVHCDPSGSFCVDMKNECIDYSSFLRLSGHSASDTVDPIDFKELSPYLLYQILTRSCILNPVRRKDTPSSSNGATAWTHGAVAVGILTGVGLLLTSLVPLLHKQACQPLLTFLVALAVGNQVGSACTYLLPQAFGVSDEGTFVWRGCTVILGVYLVHLFERVIELFLKHEDHSHGHGRPSSESESPQVDEHVQCVGGTVMPMEQPRHPGSRKYGQRSKRVKKVHRLHPLLHCVVWMVMLSDVIISFVQGIDIGIAFSSSISAGTNVAMTVLLMGIPRKLADVAVLVKADVPFKAILLFAVFLGTGYTAGWAIGMTAPPDSTLDVWLSAVVGGMLLYVALVVLLPEMNDTVEQVAKTESRTRQAKLFVVQNAGIITGVLLMALSTRYGGHIIRHGD